LLWLQFAYVLIEKATLELRIFFRGVAYSLRVCLPAVNAAIEGPTRYRLAGGVAVVSRLSDRSKINP
jgi:hypothetical protein